MSYLGLTAKVVALEVVALLGGKVIMGPALVRVTLMFLHDVLS